MFTSAKRVVRQPCSPGTSGCSRATDRWSRSASGRRGSTALGQSRVARVGTVHIRLQDQVRIRCSHGGNVRPVLVRARGDDIELLGARDRRAAVGCPPCSLSYTPTFTGNEGRPHPQVRTGPRVIVAVQSVAIPTGWTTVDLHADGPRPRRSRIQGERAGPGRRAARPIGRRGRPAAVAGGRAGPPARMAVRVSRGFVGTA